MAKEQEKQEYLESISKHTDRELLELQTYYQRKQTDHLSSMSYKVRFFYVLTVVTIVIVLIYLSNQYAKYQ